MRCSSSYGRGTLPKIIEDSINYRRNRKEESVKQKTCPDTGRFFAAARVVPGFSDAFSDVFDDFTRICCLLFLAGSI